MSAPDDRPARISGQSDGAALRVRGATAPVTNLLHAAVFPDTGSACRSATPSRRPCPTLFPGGVDNRGAGRAREDAMTSTMATTIGTRNAATDKRAAIPPYPSVRVVWIRGWRFRLRDDRR
jgi:hypothetical protein